MNRIFNLHLTVVRSRLDVILGIVFAAIALWLRLIGIKANTSTGFGSVGVVDDRLFPNIVSVIAFICALGILGIGIWDRRTDAAKKAKGQEPEKVEFSIYVIFMLILAIFYCSTFSILGYPLCNVISMYAVYFMLGGKKVLPGIVMSVVFTLCSYLFFAQYLGVVLPLGFGR